MHARQCRQRRQRRRLGLARTAPALRPRQPAWPSPEFIVGGFFDLTHDEHSGIAELVLNQPQRLNTMTPAFFTELRDTARP
jgi:hypothetical protein